jgi:hypothetical protein
MMEVLIEMLMAAPPVRADVITAIIGRRRGEREAEG